MIVTFTQAGAESYTLQPLAVLRGNPLYLYIDADCSAAGDALKATIKWYDAKGGLQATNSVTFAAGVIAFQSLSAALTVPALAVVAVVTFTRNATANTNIWTLYYASFAPVPKAPTISFAKVDTDQTQASGAAYGDLATVGPQITGLVVGMSGTIDVVVGCLIYKSTNSNSGIMSYVVANAGGTIVAASDDRAFFKVGDASGINGATYSSQTTFVGGLTPGDIISVTAKYRNDGGGVNWNFSTRRMWVRVWP